MRGRNVLGVGERDQIAGRLGVKAISREPSERDLRFGDRRRIEFVLDLFPDAVDDRLRAVFTGIALSSSSSTLA